MRLNSALGANEDTRAAPARSRRALDANARAGAVPRPARTALTSSACARHARPDRRCRLARNDLRVARPQRSRPSLRRESRASRSIRDRRPLRACWSHGGVPQRQVARGDAGAVVDNLDQVEAAAFDVDRDAGRARIDGVLDELLDDRRRAFDDLAGGDLTDRHASSSRMRHAKFALGVRPDTGQIRPERRFRRAR